MIKVKNLTKSYGNNQAVKKISFAIQKNGIVGFLGPNGAGKSTTMNMITGYISMSGGSVQIGGVDILQDPMVAKQQIGYLPEFPPLYKDLTVDEYLTFVYGLKRCRLDRKQHIHEVCEEVGISAIRNRLIGNLSKGYQQRVGIAQALIGNPPILILDEPTVGLDPSQIIQIRNLIRKLGQSRIVILSTHILSEVQLMCERIIMISRGRIVVDDSMESIEKESAKGVLYLDVLGEQEAVKKTIEAVNGVQLVLREESRYRVEYAEDTDIRVDLFHALAEKDMPILFLSEGRKSLESLFIELTGDTYAPANLGNLA